MQFFSINMKFHYESTPMQYTAIGKNDNFQLIFLTIFIFSLGTCIVGARWNRLTEAVLASTHSVCFRAKIGK